MDLDDMLIRVHPGQGLVARAGGSVLVLLAPVPQVSSVADELLSLVEASADVAAPGRRLARQVARLVAGAEPGDVPSFGLVAQAEEGLVLILHGDADADVSSPGGSEHLSGHQGATWVDRIVGQPVDLLLIGPSGEPCEPPDPRVRLKAGVVHGGGISVVPAGVTETPGATPESQAQEAFLPPVAEAVDEPKAEAVVQPPDVMPTDDTEVVGPPRGRPTMESSPEPVPSGSFGSVVPAEATVNEDIVESPPLPVGVIVFDDGGSFRLDGNYVLGREPASDPDVVSGHARPLVVNDPDRTVSRVHAAIALDGSNVILTDRGAANGTYVAAPGREGWTPLLPNQPTMIERGSRVRLGDREFRLDSSPAKQ